MTNLTDILKRDKNGKPVLKLIQLKKTAVHTPTKEVFDELMRVYNLGKWRNLYGGSSTNLDYSIMYSKGNCVDAEDLFSPASRNSFLKEGYEIISNQKFYDMQKITPEMIKEINKYFEARKFK